MEAVYNSIQTEEKCSKKTKPFSTHLSSLGSSPGFGHICGHERRVSFPCFHALTMPHTASVHTAAVYVLGTVQGHQLNIIPAEILSRLVMPRTTPSNLFIGPGKKGI